MDNKAYKELIIRRTYDFSVAIIMMSKKTPPKDFASQIIVKQLVRSATSVSANIVEAQASPTRKDFANFMSHALKSANESRHWLALLRDTAPEYKAKATDLLSEAQQIALILGSSVKSLRSQPNN